MLDLFETPKTVFSYITATKHLDDGYHEKEAKITEVGKRCVACK